MIFNELGCHAVGSDLSDEVLALARRILDEAGVDIPLHRIDYRELPRHLHKRFDAAASVRCQYAPSSV
jgi:cyclopropane fatty-acyl-phospholipid synthase-like methyltransferase